VKTSILIRAGTAALLAAAMALSGGGAYAADPPVKIISVSPDPQTSNMTVTSITYDPISRVASVSVTPNCYLVTIYPSYPGGETITFITGVGGADFWATQRDETVSTFVVGGTCGEPITMTIEGLRPGPATLAVGMLLYAEHADLRQLTYEVILR
jgi:hypothetical protein